MGRRVLIAITGASGSIYPAQMIEKLLQLTDQWEALSVVATDNAMDVWQVEMQAPFEKKEGIAYFDKNDFSAPFASGSGQYDTMIIAPCSMGALGRIANGISNDLITRAAVAAEMFAVDGIQTVMNRYNPETTAPEVD